MWNSCRAFFKPRAYPLLLKTLEKQSCIAKCHVNDQRQLHITYLNAGWKATSVKPSQCPRSLISYQVCGQRRYLSLGSGNEAADPPPKLSLVQRFKAMYKDYWYVLIPVHVVTSCVWFGAFFYTAQSGFDIAGAVEVLNLNDEIMNKIRTSANSTAGHITLSYLLYKIFTPLRYTVTLGGTTYAIKFLTARGLLKKMPKKEELRKMMEDRRDSLIDKKDNLTKEFAGKFSATKKSKSP